MSETKMHDLAILTKVTVRMPSLTKKDLRATDDAEAASNASGAGSFNKVLVDKSIKVQLTGCRNSIHSIMEKYTRPYLSGGVNILPNGSLMEFMTEMGDAITAFNKAADDFCYKFYPASRNQDQMRLGQMFDPSEYPTPDEMREKIGVEWVKGLPFPDPDNLKVDLEQQLADQIKSEMKEHVENAMRENTSRDVAKMLSLLGNIAERIEALDKHDDADGGSKPRLFSSLTENAQELCDQMKAFNFNNDPLVDQLISEVSDKFSFEAGELREDIALRRRAKEDIKAIASRMAGVFS